MQVKIEKFVFGGQGLGRLDGPVKAQGAHGASRVVFIWGGLPGEEVEFDVIKKKKNFIEGVATKILTPSLDRIEALDEHYLSCSPWQTLDYKKENEWKRIIAEETYRRIGNLESGISNLEIVAPEKPYGYRNKIEYNFTNNTAGELSLAFHHRGTHRLRPVEKCVLADQRIQAASVELIELLRGEKVTLSDVKSLIVRSDQKGSSAALFVNRMDFLRRFTLEKPAGLNGLQIYYSNPLSPASVPTELLLNIGETKLEAELNGVKLKFGLLSFFQINPAIFEKALGDIGGQLNGERVVDYYSGVGGIGLPLQGKYSEAVLIEENAEAIDFAVENIALNGFTNVKVQNLKAEEAQPIIGGDDTVILDPPRTGLHKDVTAHLLKTLPKKIIYLSCGLDTHARDISFLSSKYRPVFWKLYNFFPRTPHIEGLCVLERL